MHTKPKKSLGQNFLIDQNIQNKIIDTCNFNQDDVVLEIGPGTGKITSLIMDKVKKLYLVELDNRLIPGLRDLIKDKSNVELFHQDILKFDLNEIKSKKIKVFGNIPYYISSPIIEHLFNYRDKVETIFLTVQKEFGQRVIAQANTEHYGSFSCFVQYYSDPKFHFIIKRNSFYPAPKVDSAFLELKISNFSKVSVKNEELLFKLTRGSFQQRRKTIENSLKRLFPNVNATELLSQLGINPKDRPENLSLSEFIKIVELL